jgi:hypothetical protein
VLGTGEITTVGNITASGIITSNGTLSSNNLNALTADGVQTMGGNIDTGSITIGGALSTGSITLGGAQTTGDINIGRHTATGDIYIGNGTNNTTGANRGICSINKLQVGNTTTGNGVGTGTPYRCMIIGRNEGSTTASSGTITIPGAPTGAGNPIVFASVNGSTTGSNTFFIAVRPNAVNTFTYTKTFYNTSAASIATATPGATSETFNYIAIWL